MRAAWVVTVLMGGLVACGFYDSVPRPSDPFGGNVGIPNLPDGGLPNLPDGGGDVIQGDGGYGNRDGGLHLPGGDGGFNLPDGGFQLPDGGFTLPDGGTGSDGGSDGGAEACSGRPGVQVLASGELSPTTLALSGSDVFWVDGNGTLRRTPKAGGAVAVPLASFLMSGLLQVDADAAYFVANTGFYDLMKLPHGAPSATLLARWSSGAPQTGALAQHGATLYLEISEGLVQVGKAGGAPQLRQTGGLRQALAADAAGVYFAEPSREQLGFLDTQGTSSVLAPLTAGFSVVGQVAGPSGITALLNYAPAGASACGFSGELRHGSEAVGSLSFRAHTPGCAHALASDATHAYWTSWNSQAGYVLLRYPFFGGNVEQVAALGSFSVGIAVDDASVYWAEANTGCILRMPKPQ